MIHPATKHIFLPWPKTHISNSPIRGTDNEHDIKATQREKKNREKKYSIFLLIVLTFYGFSVELLPPSEQFLPFNPLCGTNTFSPVHSHSFVFFFVLAISSSLPSLCTVKTK